MFEQLLPYAGSKQKIRVERSLPGTPSLSGYLIGLTNELGLMHCFDDFEPDGYTLFRVAHVIDVRSNEYERHWERMLAGEGLLGGLNLDADIDLSCLENAIESVDRHFHRMIVECEAEDEELDDFYIGKLVSIDNEELRFDHFDGVGRWESEAAVISLPTVTLVQFETPYIQRFWKYLESAAPCDGESGAQP
ncbi:hypothetical protein [Lacipirellula sp.]|uniref:hypothetical protein n=1 Tax=Lacipirellula sp. TaxID=2691419 RepID=UPI003D141E57